MSEARQSDRSRSGLASLAAAIREIAIVIVLALALATLVRIFLFQAFVIPSGSMQNTLQVGDRVLVSKLTTRFGEVERGDVVVFSDPGSWLGPAPPDPDGVRGAISDALEFVGVLPSDAEGHLVKRVIGIGGDQVTCCGEDGRLSVNGVPIDESGHLKPGVEPSLSEFDVIVPKDAYWVMGDNRSNSGDSRVHGAVPADHVVGRTFAIVWPLDRWSSVPSADAYDVVEGDSP